MKNYIKYICLFLAIVGMSLGQKAWSAETLVATFASEDVVTSSGYGSSYGYYSSDWDLSMGGSNNRAGFNASNHTTIGNAYGTSANTSHDGFYIRSKNALANICKITFDYDVATTAAECNQAKIYLGYSTNGSTWNAIPLTSGSQGASLASTQWDGEGGNIYENHTTVWTFEFSKIASAYYAIIISRNGSVTADKGFAFQDAHVKFYSGCCDNIVTPAKGTRTNCEIAFSPLEVATCSSTASERQLTVTVTPNSCYAAPTADAVARASGIACSKVSGPTDNGDGTYNYVFQFAQNASGTTTFNASIANKQTYAVAYAAGTTTPTGGNAISGSHANDTKTCGVNLTLPGASFTASGYTQDGWSASSGGSKTYNLSGYYTTDAPTTLYPHWSANTISLTLDKNGGDGDGSGSVKYNATSLTSISHATRAGYVIEGYYAEAGCTNKVLTNTGVLVNYTGYVSGGKWVRATTPTTLYAKWTQTYTLAVANVDDVVISATSPSVAEGSSTGVTGGTTVTLSHGAVTSPKSWAGWNVYKTGDPSTTVTVNGSNQFTMPDYNVTVSAYLFGDLRAFCEPEVEITITGDVWLTSYAGVNVFTTNESANLITIDCDDFGDATRLGVAYLHNGTPVTYTSSPFRLCWYEFTGKSDYNLVDADGSAGSASPYRYYPLSSSEKTALGSDQTFAIRYNPGAGVYNQEDTYTLRIAALDDEGNDLGHEDLTLHGRALPQYFAIASKYNNKWYALPNTIVSNTASVTPIEVTVDNTTTPTAVTYAPTTVKYKGGARNTSTARRYAIGLYDPSDNKLKTVRDKTYVYLGSDGSTKYQDWYLESTDFGAYTLWVPSDDSEVTPKKMGISSGKIGYFGTPESPSEQIYLLPVTNWLTPNDAKVTEWGQKSVILDVDAQSPIASAQAHFGNRATAETATFGQTLTSVKESATKYNYTLTFSTTDFSTHKGELLYIDWLNSSDGIESTSSVTIPWIIAESGKMSVIDSEKDNWKDAEVHVLPGVTLEADGGNFANKVVAIKTLEIYPGATVKVTKGANDRGSLNPSTLILRNGWTRAGSKSYDVARLYIDSDNASVTNPSKAYSDWYIDYDQYYPIAVPWIVTTSGMSYLNSNNAASTGVKMRYYDGASRAENVQAGVGESANWKVYSIGGNAYPATLTPCTGYAMTAKRPTGKAFSIIRMPLTIPSSTWMTNGEQGTVGEAPDDVHKDQVTVTAHGDENTPSYAQGWNLIANPYMSLHQGALNYTTSGNVMYANIPDINFTEYDQVPIATTKLKPSSAFLIQAPKDGTVTFGTTNRKASAPSYRNTEATIPTQQAYILLGNEEVEDMMGILVNSKYTAEYEVNADLEKLLSDGNTLRTYMLYNNMNMAYLAINEVLAKELIPVAVRIPADGEYTFKMHEASVADELEGVYLTDYETGNVTNLLYDDYTFTASAGTLTNRFVINAIVGVHNTPTGLDITGADKDGPTKFIYHDKVYILHNNVIYDSTGKRVNVINK